MRINFRVICSTFSELKSRARPENYRLLTSRVFCSVLFRRTTREVFNDGQQSPADGSPVPIYIFTIFQMVINYMVHHHQEQHLDEISDLFVGLTNWWPAESNTSSEIRNVLFRLIDYVPTMNILGSILRSSRLHLYTFVAPVQYSIRRMWLRVVQTKYVTRVICHSIWIRIIGNTWILYVSKVRSLL